MKRKKLLSPKKKSAGKTRPAGAAGFGKKERSHLPATLYLPNLSESSKGFNFNPQKGKVSGFSRLFRAAFLLTLY